MGDGARDGVEQGLGIEKGVGMVLGEVGAGDEDEDVGGDVDGDGMEGGNHKLQNQLQQR